MGGITAERVTAVIVTRGDVDLDAVVRPLLRLGEISIWNNAEREDLAVYGRYAAAEKAGNHVVLIVDDDVGLPGESLTALLDAYEPGVLTANMPPEHQERYPDSALIGFGAIFDRHLPDRAFQKFWARTNPVPSSPVFNRTCDVVFATLTPRKIIDVPFTMLPHTWAENRMFKQPGNTEERTHMLDLARRVGRAS